jgi:hypothetical protein
MPQRFSTGTEPTFQYYPASVWHCWSNIIMTTWSFTISWDPHVCFNSSSSTVWHLHNPYLLRRHHDTIKHDKHFKMRSSSEECVHDIYALMDSQGKVVPQVPIPALLPLSVLTQVEKLLSSHKTKPQFNCYLVLTMTPRPRLGSQRRKHQKPKT